MAALAAYVVAVDVTGVGVPRFGSGKAGGGGDSEGAVGTVAATSCTHLPAAAPSTPKDSTKRNANNKCTNECERAKGR